MTINDILNEVYALCDTDSTNYKPTDGASALETLGRRINIALEQVVGWILEADGTWQWDDSNYTDLPIGTQTLVEAQSAYSFSDKFLEIEEVQIKDINGDWQIIQPIDQKEYSDTTPLSEDFGTDGMPEYYDKVSDDTIKLYPAPTATACTLTSGLKIRFSRTASLYTYADIVTGTQVPGFASPYHVILAYMASIPFCMTYKKDRVVAYQNEVARLKDGLIKLYSRREKDKRKVMTMRQRAFR